MAGDRVLTVRIAGDSKGAVGAIGQVQSSTIGLGKKLLKIGGLFAGLRFGKNMITDMVDVGKSYTQSMNVMQVASKATDKEMEAVRKKARELGADLTLPGVSSADAAKAMTEVVKSGYSVQEAMDAAQGSLRLAGAANIDAASAAGIMADAMSIFQLEGKEANRVADRLAQTTNSVSGEITDTAEAFKNAGSVWATAGMSVDELTTAYGLLAQNGIRGAEAGTTLKTMLMRLQAPSAKAAEIMKDLGINAYDSQGNLKSLRDIVKNYTNSTKGMTQEEKDRTAATLFGTRAVKGANLVLNRGVDKVDKMAKAIDSQSGAAKTAAARNEGFGGAVDALEGQMEDFYLTVWEKVAPGLEKITRKAAAGLEAFNDFVQGPKDLAASLNEIDGDAVGEKIKSMVEKALDKVAGLAGGFAKSIGKMFAGVDWVGLGIELGKMAVPMLVGLALGILNFDLGALLKGLADNWQAVLFGVLTIMFAPAKWIAKLAGLLRKIPFVGRFLAWIVTGINKVGSKFKSIFKKFFKGFGDGFKTALGWTGPGLIVKLVGLFMKMRGKIVEWGSRMAARMGQAAIDMGRRLGNWLGRHGPKQAYQALAKIKNRIFGFLSNAGNWLVRHGGNILGGLMTGLRNRMGVVMGWFRSVHGKVLAPFANAGTWLYNAGGMIIRGFINGIKSKFGDVKATLGGLTSKLTSWKGPESLDKVILRNAGQLVIGGFAEGLESQYGTVRKSLGDFTRSMARTGARTNVGKAITEAMSGDLSGLQASQGALPRRALTGASMGQNVTVIVKVAGNVIGEKDFAKRVTPTVRDELKKIGNRNSGRIFGE